MLKRSELVVTSKLIGFPLINVLFCEFVFRLQYRDVVEYYNAYNGQHVWASIRTSLRDSLRGPCFKEIYDRFFNGSLFFIFNLIMIVGKDNKLTVDISSTGYIRLRDSVLGHYVGDWSFLIYL